ncbi:MAG: ATP-binding protein [Proteobacteria bacterium]|nr:ATP-binding protein [Pseudomonadota bacterium]MCP4919664.1 ATP-binding protein [Pseudomonadota bacterium]
MTVATPEPARGCPICRGLGMIVGAHEGAARGALCTCVVSPSSSPEPDAAWCPRCKDTGRAFVDGRWLRCKCRLLPDRIALYNRIKLPARHGGSTFMSWNMTLPGAAPELVYLKKWAEDFKPSHPGFVLFGPVGRGKTHLLASALREIAFAHGARARFVEFTHLLSDLKRTFDQRHTSVADILDEVMDCDVLAIDELGKGRCTEWELQVLDELVSRAYNGQITLVGTTNYMPGPATGRAPRNLSLVGSGSAKEKEDAQTLGDRVSDRVYSRLTEMVEFKPIGLTRIDHRQLP